MGAVINNNQGPAPAGQSSAAPQEQRELTLAEKLASDQDQADLDAQNRPSGDASSDQSGADAAPQVDPIASRFDKLEKSFEEERADRKMERQMLLGALNQARQPATVRVETPAPKPAEPPPPSDEQLLESLKADPLNTIRRITADATSRAVRETEERLTGKITKESEETRANVAFQDRMRQSALSYQQQFSDVLEGPQGEAFDRECGQELVAMYGDNWQQRIQPDGPINAASRVYTRWSRQGKLAPAGQNGSTAPAANGQPRLREIIRQPPSNDRVQGSSGAPRGGSREPSTIGDLGLNATEERAARRVMGQWGLDEKTWVRNYLAAKQDNPNFGNG